MTTKNKDIPEKPDSAAQRKAQPRRSVLFMPASNDRAVAKITQLDVDTVILDLEDSVLPEQKEAARQAIASAFDKHDFANREVLVRINALDSEWWQQDLAAAMNSPASGIVVPKIENPQQVAFIVEAMRATGQGPRAIWIMLETPLGIMSAREICGADPALTAVLIGTADLGKELRAPERPDRLGLITSLGQVVLAARAAHLSVIDGVYMDIRNEDGLQAECEQGVALGFDGKSLIHPSQLAITNRLFSPSPADVELALQMLNAWEESRVPGAGVCVLNNRLVEHLHVKRAQEIVDMATAIENR